MLILGHYKWWELSYGNKNILFEMLLYLSLSLRPFPTLLVV